MTEKEQKLLILVNNFKSTLNKINLSEEDLNLLVNDKIIHDEIKQTILERLSEIKKGESLFTMIHPLIFKNITFLFFDNVGQYLPKNTLSLSKSHTKPSQAWVQKSSSR